MDRVACVGMCVTVGNCAGERPRAMWGMLDDAVRRARPVENTALAWLVKTRDGRLVQ